MAPEVIENLKSMKQPSDGKPLSLEETRKMMTMLATEAKEPLPKSLTEVYHSIPMRDGFANKIKVIRPLEKSPGPLVVLFFGGSFVSGDLEQLVGVGRNLAQLFDATVVCPDYRLAPEHIFPQSQLDAWDTMKWVALQATSSILGADPHEGFLIGGVSAGACLSACLTRQFQEQPLAHPITGQWLCIPSIVGRPENLPEKYQSVHVSIEQCAEAPFLNKKTLGKNIQYTKADISSPLRYAIKATTPVSEQPRTYFQAGGLDPLRDDALVYDEILKEAGVATKLDLYDGVPHGYFNFPPFKGSKIHARANIDIYAGFGWLLGRSTKRDDIAKLLGVTEN